MRLGASALVMFAFMGASATAGADERDACIEASSRGQKLKLERKLKEARAQLQLCARSECPATVRQDCAAWMNEVLGSIASVVVGARDAKGRDLVQVKVVVDGVVTAERLEGRAIEIDPGVHTFRYEAQGFPAVTEQLVVREGEKNRPITVTFAGSDEKTPETARPSERPAPVTADTPSTSGPPVAAYVVGGAGIVALGVAAYLGLHSNGRADDLKNGCGATRSCTQEQVSSVDNERTMGWIVGGVGLAAVGVAVVLLVTHSSGPKTTGAASVTPWVGPAGGGVGLRF